MGLLIKAVSDFVKFDVVWELVNTSVGLVFAVFVPLY